jgi:DNA-binding NtrC family response regulator
LVADDEEVIRELLRRRLKNDGYKVEVAEDGGEAVAIVEREEFVNLVLTDVRMPVLDGVEVLRRVKAKNPDTEVIMMTAYASTETAVEAVRQGAFDYLQKPFEHVDDVAHKVKQALRHQYLSLQNRDMMRKLDELNKGLKGVVVSRTKELNAAQESLRAANRQLRELIRSREATLAALNADVRRALEEIMRVAGGGDAGEAVRREAERALAIVARVAEPIAVPAAAEGEEAGE